METNLLFKMLQFPNKKYKKASIWLIQKYKANIKL